MKKKINIYGAGLVGSLLSALLAKRGFQVSLNEAREDSRNTPAYKGRSINLALSERGWRALAPLNIEDKIKSFAIPMYGRVMHPQKGETYYQPYSTDGKCIYSASRRLLNLTLLNQAEENGVELNFNQPLKNDTELSKSELHFGADGARSVMREHITDCNPDYDKLSHSYKEIDIPTVNGEYAFEQFEALHIWPRESFMFIALPNPDKTFTGTLFLANEGQYSFESLEGKLYEFFSEQFPDATAVVSNIKEQLEKNPVTTLGTVYCENWIDDNKALIGDASHAIVPFYGQGMNSGFEDCNVLLSLVNNDNNDWDSILKDYFELRKPDGDAIAHLALSNFIEMRDKVADDSFILRKKIENILHKELQEKWIPLYEMVTFENIRYSEALEKGKLQRTIMDEIIKIEDINSWYETDIKRLINSVKKVALAKGLILD